jgi:phosphoserine phosphatase RsbU/P
MATLRYLDDNGQCLAYKLDSGQILIGRAETCQISVESDMISREHARIELTPDGRFRAVDLGSRNKSFVNGEQISETILTAGDVLRVGDRIFEFVDETNVSEVLDMRFLTPEKGDPPGAEWVKFKQPVSLTIGQLERVAQVGADQALTGRAEDVASAALGRVILDLNAERGFIALRGDKKMELRPIAHRGLAQMTGGSLTPVSEAFVLAPILQQVAGCYPQSARQIDKKLGYAVTGVVAPLTDRGEIIGILYVDRPSGKRPFPTSSTAYAIAAGAQIGSLLGSTLRSLPNVAARESAAWMTTIRRVQDALSETPKSSDSYQLAEKRFPGRARRGDFVWVHHVDEQQLAILLVDCGGHGMTGLAQAAMIRGAVSTAIRVDEDSVMDPASMFNAINTIVANSSSHQVLPTLYIAIDSSVGKLSYINAGGVPPLLMLKAGRLLTMDQTSLVLGVDAEYVYEATRVDLPDAFRLIVYTDGLVDASGAGGEALGSDRLHDALLASDSFGSADDVLGRIVKLWTTHLSGATPDDDATALVVARGWAAS